MIEDLGSICAQKLFRFVSLDRAVRRKKLSECRRLSLAGNDRKKENEESECTDRDMCQSRRAEMQEERTHYL